MNAKNFAKEFLASYYLKLFGGRGEFGVLKDRTAIVLENKIPKDVCEKLRAIIDEVIDGKNNKRVWRDELGADTRILGFESDVPEYVSYFEVESNIAKIKAYLGMNVKSWLLMANRIRPVAGNLGSGGGLHRDSPYSHQVKCIWYLSDVGSDNGPFQYVPGSHVGLIGKGDKYPLGQSRFDQVDEELVEVIAEAGSQLVCDTKCIHAGKPITEGYRYAVTLYTFASENGARDIFRKSGLKFQ